MYIWDSDTNRPYQWNSKRFQAPLEMNLRAARIRRTNDAESLTLKLYSDGVLYFTKTISDSKEFVCPDDPVEEFNFRLEGTATVKTVEFAEDMQELQ